jgi:HD-GYP domain-containing protein (c-di-GMP phosphodiesterase class II)
MQRDRGDVVETPPVRWPELIAAMSLACDTGMGLPLETGLATCLVASQMGRAAGLSHPELERTYRLAMLQHVGCTAVASENAEVMGDELVMRKHSALLDLSDNRAMFRFMLGHVARVNPVLDRPLALARAVAGGRRLLATGPDVCEAGRMLGARCGYDTDNLSDLETVYENWDGSGLPLGLSGDALPVPVQLVQVAALAVNAERMLGADAAVALVRSRSGHTLSPTMAQVFLADPEGMLSVLRGRETLWDAVLEAEPEPTRPAAPVEVDEALSAIADFADLIAPCLVGHSRGVARLAGAAAATYGLSPSDVSRTRWAGYVHDVGRVSVSASIWNCTGPLTPDQREKVRLHPYYTQRVLDRAPFLRSLSEIASTHHERLDGSGYFRGATGSALTAPARIMAAADVFQTKSEPRPHRPALGTDAVAQHMTEEAAAGRLDQAAVDAVLEVAGRPRPVTRPRLTPREIEILGAAARGGSIREVARSLGIAPKTVDGHLQRIYPKIGVSTRSGATLYALEHGILPTA